MWRICVACLSTGKVILNLICLQGFFPSALQRDSIPGLQGAISGKISNTRILYRVPIRESF